MQKTRWAFIFLLILLCCGGCDPLYRLLQKEGAEEKDLLGVIIPRQKNEKVEQVQGLLKLYGYKVGNVDGALGANTRKAIGQFQKNNDLDAHRFVDKATWDALNMFAPYGLVVEGNINIYAVQVALNASGIETGKPDGKIGNKTLDAIKRFQKASGLKADGKVGFRTLKALSQYLEALDD